VVSASELPHSTTGDYTIQQIPGPGEHIGTFDAPKQHHGKKFVDFMHLLRVNTSAGKPHLEDK
jgi:hypothetical protein